MQCKIVTVTLSALCNGAIANDAFKTRPGHLVMPDPPLLVGLGKEGPIDRQTDEAFCRPTPWVWQKG